MLYAKDALAVDLEETAYAPDSTTIDLCLSLFPWARFRTTKAAVKLHMLLDLRGTVREKRPVDRTTGLRSDHTVVLDGMKTAALYPEPLSRVAFYDAEHKRRLVFLADNFALPAPTIADLSKSRWQIELLFK